MTPRVSILMPVAAPAPFLGDAIASLIHQTSSAWDLVAVLDGPAKDEAETLTAMVPRDRLTIVRRPVRQGIAQALNLGLMACPSELVARLDSDDLAEPGRIEAQANELMTRPSTLMVGGHAWLISEQGPRIGERRVPVGTDIRKKLLTRNRFIHSTVMFRREAVIRAGLYNAACHLREDYELWLRLGTLGAVSNIDEHVGSYRVSSGQSSRGRSSASARIAVKGSRMAIAAHLGVPAAEVMWRDWTWRAAQHTSRFLT